MAKVKQTIDQKIDALATAVKRGFDGMDERFARLDEMNKLFIDRFERIETDTKEIKLTLISLVKMVADRDREMRGMDLRLRRVERRLGLINN